MPRLVPPAAILGLALGVVSLLAWPVAPAAALTMQECSGKYQAAKRAGTLGGRTWPAFRQAECGVAPDAATTTRPNPFGGGGTATPPATTAPAPKSPQTAAAAKPAPSPAPSAAASSVAYPSAVDPRYAKETPGKARMHTCLDAYNAAKAAGTLGGAKWIEKGGGYYSGCNRRLKG